MREFATEVMRPLARDCDEQSQIPSDFLKAVWELGLTSTQLPEAYGGGGEERSPVTNAILLEELAYGDAALAAAAMAPSAVANAILEQGTEEQKQRFLPDFCGERFHAGALALVESGPVSDPLRPRTVAEAKGEGFVISGAKSLIAFGDRASQFLVVARNGDGLDVFIVDADAEGVSVSEIEKNMGLRALPTVSLELERVEVLPSARLGGDAGCDVARIVDSSRVALAAIQVGLSRAVLDFCVPYSKDRVAFDEPISKKQSIAFRLAEMHMEIEAMRNLTWQAASALEHGRDAGRETRLARTYVAEKAMWIADNGIQVLGGHGYIREHPVEMWFRHARVLSVVDGIAGL
jgi:alkylation response protein AidB-like acyl-CoA dehydrogenase